MKAVWPVAVVGGGPAGISCSLQLKRYGYECLVFEEKEVGGLAVNARRIENLLGFSRGISGPDFVRRIKEQAEAWRLPVERRKIETVRRDGSSGLFILAAKGRIFRARRLVVATGSFPLQPDFLDQRTPAGVFYEINGLRDAKGLRIAVLGGGDLAFDYALSLAEQNEVILLCRSRKMKALRRLVEEARRQESVTLRCPVSVENLTDRGGKQVVTLAPGEEQLEVDSMVVAIGRRPELGCLSPELLRQRGGLEQEGRLWIIGDAGHPRYRQISIAAGEGIRAAMAIHRRQQAEER